MVKYMILTHAQNEKLVRRFFVTSTQRKVYHQVEGEIWRMISNFISSGKLPNLALSHLHTYVEMRLMTYLTSNFQYFVDMTTLRAHLLDYCDIQYSRIHKFNTKLPYRMFKYSEPLAINKGEVI